MALGKSFRGLVLLALWVGAGASVVGSRTMASSAQEEVHAKRDADSDWPTFRGSNARGVSEGPPTPVRWDLEKRENILWTTEIPGLGHSSPIISAGRLYLTTAVRQEGEASLRVGLYGAGESVENEGAHSFRVYCLDTESGKVLWEKEAHNGVPKIKRHPKSSHANSTPATDGRHVVAFFGSEGLYCFSTDGELLWKRDLGVLDAGAPGLPGYQWGFASSPVIHQGRVIVQCDIQEGSFLAALDLQTGQDVWRTTRSEQPSWGTPTVHTGGDRAQVIVNGYRHIGGYELESGKEIWKLVGGGDVPVPTPVVAHELIFITNAHGRMAPVYAIKTNVSGEITADPRDGHMAWSQTNRGNYMQTPLVYGEYLYCCHDTGVLSCYEAKTGELMYRERLGGGGTGFSASPVACDGKIYFSSEEGQVYVVPAGPDFEVLAVNEMQDNCMATPAISNCVLYLRTRSHVHAVSAR